MSDERDVEESVVQDASLFLRLGAISFDLIAVSNANRRILEIAGVWFGLSVRLWSGGYDSAGGDDRQDEATTSDRSAARFRPDRSDV